MPSNPGSLDRTPLTPESSPALLLVEQPKSARLDMLLAEIAQITESPTHGATEGGFGGSSLAAQSSSQTISPREASIAALPDPPVMLTRLTRHIEQAITVLRKEARRVPRLGRPGQAHHLNEIYLKIRQLQSLLMTILEVSYEVLRRLFVRIIIDHQPIL